MGFPVAPLPAEQFTDYGVTTQVSGCTTAPAAGTPDTLVVTSSAAFPALGTAAQTFYFADPAAPAELFQVTAITGTTWSVVRGAQGTTPATHSGGFTVKQVVSPYWYQQVSSAGLAYALASGAIWP